MTTFLVLKRVKEDWVSLPGELLIDPPNSDLLIKRGYLIPVPDEYPGAVSKPSETKGAPTLTVTESLESEETPADSPITFDEPTTRRRPVARRK